MTTLAAAYDVGANRFFLAADGRATDTVANCVRSDSEQKVFTYQNTTMNLAYSMTGYMENDEGTFKAQNNAGKLIEHLGKRIFDNGKEFAKRFAHEMLKTFQRSIANGLLHDITTGNREWFIKIYLVGFYKSQPFWAEVMLCQDAESGELTKKIVPGDLSAPMRRANGSTKIAKMFQGSEKEIDPRFSAYVKDSQEGSGSFVISFVRACADPVAIELDPSCKETGGHVHALEVTRSGLNWLIPPIPEDSAKLCERLDNGPDC